MIGVRIARGETSAELLACARPDLTQDGRRMTWPLATTPDAGTCLYAARQRIDDELNLAIEQVQNPISWPRLLRVFAGSRSRYS